MSLIKTYFDKTKAGLKNTLNQPLANLPNPFNPTPPHPQPEPQLAPPPPVESLPATPTSPTPMVPPQLQIVESTKEEVQETPKKAKGPGVWKKTAKTLKNPWLAVIIFVIFASAVNGYFLLGFNKQSNLINDLAKAGTAKVLGTGSATNKNSDQRPDNEALVSEVGGFFLLPNEEAEVATVKDVNKLRETEDFFDIAKNGDKLLVFKKTKKVILYRPSEKKIVDVAPLLDDQSPNSSQTPLLPGN